MGEQGGDQIAQTVGLAKVTAVASQMHACQHRLQIAGRGEGLYFRHDIAQMPALPRATGDGGHAKGAFVVAPILYFNEGAGSAGGSRMELAQKWLLVVNGQVGVNERVNALDELGFVAVGDNGRGSLNPRQLLRGDGGVAPCQQNVGRVVEFVEPPREHAGIAGRLGRDGAGVDDDFICLGRVGHHLMASRQQLPSHCFYFAVVQPATNAVQINFHGQSKFWRFRRLTG